MAVVVPPGKRCVCKRWIYPGAPHLHQDYWVRAVPISYEYLCTWRSDKRINIITEWGIDTHDGLLMVGWA